MSRVCVVAAGGTGGHMFPAEALALTRRRPGAYEPGASLPQRRRILP